MSDPNAAMGAAVSLANKGLNMGIGLLVGIIVAAIVVLILIIVGIVCCCKKCHAKNVILNHGAPTTYINGQPVPMQASVYQPGNQSFINNMGGNQMPPITGSMLTDTIANGKTPLLNNQTPYGNYGNNNL
jgi:hypothetical protein